MLSGGVFKFGTGWGNNLKELFIGRGEFLCFSSREHLDSILRSNMTLLLKSGAPLVLENTPKYAFSGGGK
jgi:hypothetical protein